MKSPFFLCSLVLSLALGAAQLGPRRAPAVPHARVLLVTGMEYPGHLWQQTAPALADLLRKDPRLEVFTVEDPNFLDSAALARFDAVVFNWQNWQQPGPGERARENLRRFVAGGKGLVLVHFACGAWHDEWPGFVQLAGRVWFGSGGRQHDPYGPFRVEITKPEHPIVKGLGDFETRDELYTCLTGDTPVEVLAQAKSKADGKYYPMALIANHDRGRTFLCTLGHDVKALSVEKVQQLYRRGTAWAAGLPPVPAVSATDGKDRKELAGKALKVARKWYVADAEGKGPTVYFGAMVLEGTVAPAQVHGDPARLERIRAAAMPKIDRPILFDTPEADAIVSALEVFPPDNPWNLVVEDWPLHPNSNNIIELKKYGMFVADNGLDWTISVAPDSRIPLLHEEFSKIKGSAFEVVQRNP